MLTFTCPITGLAHHSLFSATNKNKHELKVIHPVLQIGSAKLLKMSEPTNRRDWILLYSAHLYQLSLKTIKGSETGKIVIISGKLNFETFSDELFVSSIESLENIARFINKSTDENTKKILPCIRLSHETEADNFTVWLTSCLDIINNIPAYISPTDIVANQLWKDKKPVQTNAKAMRNKVIRAYLEDTFIQLAPEKINLYFKIVTNANKMETMLLQLVKSAVLDHGLESRPADYMTKRTIVDILSKAMIDNLQVLESLGVDDPENKRILEELQQNYSVIEGGFSYKDTVRLNKETGNALTKVDNLPPPPTTEPVREDFKSDFAFMIATRRWKETQTS